MFAVATQRTSFAISGPYQDLLEWARVAKSGKQFFERLALKGVASDAMRSFAQTFRSNLVVYGVADEDEAIWGIFRRFLIIEFDFESAAPQARAHALTVAAQVLAPEDAGRAEALWGNLIELVIKTGKAGGVISREELPAILAARGFRLAGGRDYTTARARLAEMARLALKDIGSTVGGVNIPRLGALAAFEEARNRQYRIIEITGNPGVGKSWMLRHLAERIGRESNVIVLDPVGTPDGGWPALAQRLGVPGTAKDFLGDLAAGGGGVIFIDGLEMFVSPERRRTVNDLLRESAAIDGFSVVISTRPDFDADGRGWLAEDALALLGAPHRVAVGELDDEEVAALSQAAPELRALLAPGHHAARISRNLYRLTQLLKVPSSVEIRTEADLADRWWRTADGAEPAHVRAAQRILADIASATLAGRDTIELTVDSPAREHLLRSLTLSEPKRDCLGFYHDVLRDWAIGALIHEDIALLDGVDLTVPPSPRLMRGIEFASRFALEKLQDGSSWQELLTTLSPAGAHDAWRRQALMALVRSELAPALLNRCKPALLARGGALLSEVCTAIAAVETSPASELLAQAATTDVELPKVPRSVRAATTPSAFTVVMWCVTNAAEIPIQAIGAIVKLVEIQIFLAVAPTWYGQAIARMLFNWLMQLDIDTTDNVIPSPIDAPKLQRQARQYLVEDLRSMALLLAANAPDEAKAYLVALTADTNRYRLKQIRPFSQTLAGVAPVELAAVVEASLIEEPRDDDVDLGYTDRAFSFADSDYLPASPAQPPFLDLLVAAPPIGLALIRKLVDTAVAFHSRGRATTTNGFTLDLGDSQRFFPWLETYFWARGQSAEHCAASGLLALEAWSHDRLDKGEDVQSVLDDILGPPGSCAAYLVVAIDVLLSHWPKTRDALVPFLANPAMLANDRTRTRREAFAGLLVGKEPNGRVRLDDLARRPSRHLLLEHFLHNYLPDDEAGHRLRDRLRRAVAEFDPYEEDANFGDPAFMGAFALNRIDRDNWVEVDGMLSYQSPTAETEHLARLEEQRVKFTASSETEAKIQLATNNRSKGSPEIAREAVEYAAGELPDDSDTDQLKSRSTRLIATAMLVARDGDDALLHKHEAWVRQVVTIALEEKNDRYGSGDILGYNRPAMAIGATAHLWRRLGSIEDRRLLLEAVTRKDLAAVPAFASALESINGTDPRILKSAIRIAFGCCRYRWHPYDEDPAITAAYDAEKEGLDAEAVRAEIAWLDGATQPEWPDLPKEHPSLRSRSLIGAPRAVRLNEASVHVDSQAIGKWLGLLSGDAKATPAWCEELVEAYASWSAGLNAHGSPADAELNNMPDDWNNAFYILVAKALMDAGEDRLDPLLTPILELPDRSFCDVADVIIFAIDVLYFNDRNKSADRALELRNHFVTRMTKHRRWSWDYHSGGTGIDYETGPPVGKLLMNLYSAFGGTQTYLVPAVFDRVDPLLQALRPLLAGGPTAFIALCTMNTLLVTPTARHLDFLLSAIEVWLEATRSDPSMWHTLGIGRKVAEWFEKSATDDPSLLGQAHVERARIDAILGRLVGIGVSEAHDVETRIQVEAARN
ncbi:NACHT domain-containing protein [Rhizobium ruizarguesonis]|uniref:hypothetical protein n=1 Tax=Rhizobium ruizarguesonis TaxID=2081791 RepID=UPI001FE1793C|nr:hypothetical protein [Rhizobium ruizarguesonis]